MVKSEIISVLGPNRSATAMKFRAVRSVQPNFRYAWRTYFDDYTHRAVFTDTSLPALLRAHGFTIEQVQPRFLPYSMRERRLPIHSWMVRAYLRCPIKPVAGQMFVAARRS